MYVSYETSECGASGDAHVAKARQLMDAEKIEVKVRDSSLSLWIKLKSPR